MNTSLRHTHSKWFLILALGLSSISATAVGQELKIGFINTDRIFRDANSAKAAQAKLEQEFLRREKDLTDQGNQLKAIADKLEPTTFMDLDWRIVNRQLEREAQMRRSGPIAENLLRDVGPVSSKVS